MLTSFFSKKQRVEAEEEEQEEGLPQDAGPTVAEVEAPQPQEPLQVTLTLGAVLNRATSFKKFQKFLLLTEGSKPPPRKPLIINGRSFQAKWQEKHAWLSYDEGGGLCRYCVLFGDEVTRGLEANHQLSSFVKKRFINFKKAYIALQDHEKTACHRYSTAAAGDFQKTRADRGQAVDRQLAIAREEERSKNRAGMKEVIKVIIFGAMNSLPFRGHRDDGRVDLTDSSQNDGIFRNLLRFSCASGNQTLHSFISKPNTVLN